MKSKLVSMAVISLFLSAQIHAQAPRPRAATRLQRATLKSNSNPCIDLLKDGLRDTYVTADHVSFFSDSKHYFASDQFVQDYHDGKWNGGISVLVDAVPIGLSGGSSDQDLHVFQQKIQQSSSVVIQLETYSTITRSTLNVDLANAYNACVESTQKFGLSIDVNGTKTVAVTVKYKPLASGDRKPTIASVDLLGVDDRERDNLLKGRLKNGTILQDQLAFTATRKPGEEFVITINTSNGLSIVKRLESDDDNVTGNVPIGTVISSMIDFDSFNRLTRNNTASSVVWSPVKSKWSPCDGRSVAGSKYQVLWAGSIGANAPDLRGVFLRGLNQFDPLEPALVNPLQANPDPTKRNEFQKDIFESHTHDYTDRQEGVGNQADGGHDVGLDKVQNKTTTAAGGKETRPKNVSLFYYIRIN